MIIYIKGILRVHTSAQFDFRRPSKYTVITFFFTMEIFLILSSVFIVRDTLCMITITNITKQEKLFADVVYDS